MSEKNCAHWTNGRFDQTEKKMGVEVHNERKKDGHKMYGRSGKCIQNDGSCING